MTMIKDNSKLLDYRSELDLLRLIDKSFDRFSYQGDGKWQDITKENAKQMKLTKKSVQRYYEYRRLGRALKKLIAEYNLAPELGLANILNK